MSLNVQIEDTSGYPPRIFLSGRLDECAQAKEVLGSIRQDAVLNLSKIDRVNSVGLIEWLRGITHLTSTHTIAVEAISRGMATYAGHLDNLFGKARILSCMAPYFCARCGKNTEVEIRVQELETAGGVPDARCPNCQTEMDFDEREDYFAFIQDPE